MEKTKIDWCDSTWNPVTGCLHGCEYCYARGIANRFGDFETIGRYNLMPYGDKCLIANAKCKTPYPAKFTPTLHRYRLNDYENKKARNIFVCSMADLFGEWVPDSWLDEVFAACDNAPQHNYIFLTKNVKRYVEYGVPRYFENGNGSLWYGISITNKNDVSRFNSLPARCNTFVSIEPILEDLRLLEKSNIIFRQVDWFIIGAETGRRKDKVIPKKAWIEDIVKGCKEYKKPVFMKSSLAEIWGDTLIQEFPKELVRGVANEG